MPGVTITALEDLHTTQPNLSSKQEKTKVMDLIPTQPKTSMGEFQRALDTIQSALCRPSSIVIH